MHFNTNTPASAFSRITLIGSGNVGYHLGRRLHAVGVEVVQVFSRDKEKAGNLAAATGARAATRLDQIEPGSELYILAVSDDAIASVAGKLRSRLPEQSAIVHTSGATPSSVLAPFFPRYGIFYPLQTFSRGREPSFDTLPICVHSPDEELASQLAALGHRISRSVHRIDDAQRAVLHVGAVFVNNFTNHLFHIGQEILADEGLSFGLLLPLIRETVNKIEENPARDMQTGPARRGDQETISRHLEYLKKFPQFEEVYQVLTKSIQKLF